MSRGIFRQCAPARNDDCPKTIRHWDSGRSFSQFTPHFDDLGLHDLMVRLETSLLEAFIVFHLQPQLNYPII